MSNDAAFAQELLQQSIAAAIQRMLPEDDSTSGYLQASIYPTLVPAMEELLREVERCKRQEVEPPQPLEFVASFLMRHNPGAIPEPVPADEVAGAE